MKTRGALLSMLLASGAHAQAADGPRVEASEPRAFGYQLGDLVQRNVSVHAPDGWRLDEATLPRPGGRGQALELRRAVIQTQSEPGGRRHDLVLEYQVFLSPATVRTIEIAPMRLRFDGAGRSEELLVEAWPVTVAPLAPVLVSPRRGLGELQPDRDPPLIDTSLRQLRLIGWSTAMALVLGWLAWLHLGLPWRAARNQPFGRAWRVLRDLPLDLPEVQWRSAVRLFHEALNRSAGEVLFEPGLERFLADRPAFHGVRDDLVRFMRLSRALFFADAPRANGDAAWLVELGRRCRDAERGLV